MKNQPFRFKQFVVNQEKGAMKVNTDGVLLGAWTKTDNQEHILDIGTGTGVIALMMAQKNLEAFIDAIDIDSDSCTQARENFSNSLWKERFRCFNSSLQNFDSGKQYDLIISNPPYFIDSHKSSYATKNKAKHADTLSYQDLLKGIARLMAPTGRASLVLPVFNFAYLEDMAREEELFVTRQTEVIAVSGKLSYLVLAQLERKPKHYSKSEIHIQHESGDFTDEYMSMTREFYLKF